MPNRKFIAIEAIYPEDEDRDSLLDPEIKISEFADEDELLKACKLGEIPLDNIFEVVKNVQINKDTVFSIQEEINEAPQ